MILGTGRSADGAGGTARPTLDGLLSWLAQSRPAAPALIDPADRPAFTDGASRRLTWQQLDEEVTAFAARVAVMGLGRDTIIGVQLPNIAEQAVAILGLMRAGMIPALLPLAWRRREISRAIADLGAKGLVTVSRAGPVPHAEMMCEVAFDCFTIRFVMAFGSEVPDGVIRADGPVSRASDRTERPGVAADHVAAITFEARADGFVPVPRSHAQITAAALTHVVAAGVEAEHVVATTLLAGTIAGLATGLATALVTGAPLVLHQPFSSRVFAGALATERVTHAVVPGAAAAALAAAGRLGGKGMRGVTAVWRQGESMQPIFGAPCPVVDLVSFGETGFLAHARTGEAPIRLGTGGIRAPGSTSAEEKLVEAAVLVGRLRLRGSMVPVAGLPGRPSLPADRNGYVDTGIKARKEPDGTVTLLGTRDGVVRVGGLSFPRGMVDELLGAGDGFLTLSEDPVFGHAVEAVGQGLSADRASRGVSEAGASPALTPRSALRNPRAEVA